MTYSSRHIEQAVRCVEDAQKADPIVSAWAIFSHLEGRCGCDRNRCPECGERERNGITIHKVSCPALLEPK